MLIMAIIIVLTPFLSLFLFAFSMYRDLGKTPIGVCNGKQFTIEENERNLKKWKKYERKRKKKAKKEGNDYYPDFEGLFAFSSGDPAIISQYIEKDNKESKRKDEKNEITPETE